VLNSHMSLHQGRRASHRAMGELSRAPENLIALCPNCHRRAGKGEIDKKSIRIYKANLRLTHDKFSQFEVDLYSLKLSSCQPIKDSFIDAEYVTVTPSGYNAIISGVQMGPSLLSITDSGRAFVRSLDIEHGN
jgi:hypothetical protein